MPIGTIGSPATWLQGTVVTPAWTQNVQDTVNHLIGSNYVCSGLFTTTGGTTPVINLSTTSYNVTSVARTGVGVYTVTIGAKITRVNGGFGIVMVTQQTPISGIASVTGSDSNNTTFTVVFSNSSAVATDPSGSTSAGFMLFGT